MKRDIVISQLKQLLNAVDKLEFNVEQNRKQIAETRLLVANVARTIYFERKKARGKIAGKKKVAGKKEKR